MERCFSCHSRKPHAVATGACDACHPEAFKLLPVSHKKSAWMKQHGKCVLQKREGRCAICHEDKFCQSCHVVDMPHPGDWAKGESGHRKIRKCDWPTCQKCHDEGSQFCSACHHTGYNVAKGAWVQQHFSTVRQGGVDKCVGCHVPTYCAKCHIRSRKAS